ncbi:hypothetical protein V6N13_001095 [Hibiscus sabdariffa]
MAAVSTTLEIEIEIERERLEFLLFKILKSLFFVNCSIVTREKERKTKRKPCTKRGVLLDRQKSVCSFVWFLTKAVNQRK